MTYAVWGWGGPGDEPRPADLESLGPFVEPVLGFAAQAPEAPAGTPELPASRVQLPGSLAALASWADDDRARHSIGRSYRDVVRGLRGQLEQVVDVVLQPSSEAEVAACLEWASATGVAVIPFGGGTSVVGGVEPDGRPAASLDLSGLSGVIELDPTSRAARIAAGTTGPDLEASLKPHGLTARFYPQSFERSTVGGWLATRAAGHYATRLQHVDDLVESVTAITPAGRWESRRLPGSGAGPSPDRMLLGSEGTLGVITEGWLRVQQRPVHRASAQLTAPDFDTGAEAIRQLVQSGLAPETCRLVDAAEAAFTGALATGQALVVLGAESAYGPVSVDAAVELCQDAGLTALPRTEGEAAGDGWRSTFLRAPYLREQLVLLGVLIETFETSMTWDRLPAYVASVRAATEHAVREVAGAGVVTCRLTHCYPDGAAPYFTVLAPARRGSELAQWAEVKAAASEAIIGGGGTITHHHAVGRDHAAHYAQQRPELFARALSGAKAALDPAGVMNPGVLGYS